MTDDVYAQLSAEFDVTFFRKGGGGAGLEYVTGEQVVSRLNEVLGAFGWSFEILSQDYFEATDEECVRGRMGIRTVDGVWIYREQFGSQIRNKRQDGKPLEIGFDRKGAATDCLKKCASLFGVGLYLSDNTRKRQPTQQRQEQRPGPERTPTQLHSAPANVAITCVHPTGERDEQGHLLKCGNQLEAVPDRHWAPSDLAKASWQLTKYPMCWGCYQVEEGKTAKTG